MSPNQNKKAPYFNKLPFFNKIKDKNNTEEIMDFF